MYSVRESALPRSFEVERKDVGVEKKGFGVGGRSGGGGGGGHE